MPPFSTAVLFVFLLTAVPASAQEASEDSTAWKKQLTAILAGSQASYNNWAEGGFNSLAFTTSLDGQATRRTEHLQQNHEMRLALGLLKQDSLDIRKSDDLIQWTSTFEYVNDTNFRKWHPTASLTLRSQFAYGFDYKTTPETKVSSFFAPATLTQTIGFTNQPVEWFTWLIGIAAKETIVAVERFRTIHGNAIDEAVRFEPGFNTTLKVNKDVFENVHLKSSLNVFGAFGHIAKPDVRWENLVTMKVNSWLTVNFEYVMFYDRDITKKVQIKEVLSTGLSFRLL